MIETAIVLPILLLVVLLAFSMEYIVFQSEELRDVAIAAMHDASVPCDGSKTVSTCAKGILERLQPVGPTLALPSKPSDCAVLNADKIRCEKSGVTICVVVQPTIYSPSVVFAQTSAQLRPIGPVALFHVSESTTATSTNSPTGVPGAAPPLTCP